MEQIEIKTEPVDSDHDTKVRADWIIQVLSERTDDEIFPAEYLQQTTVDGSNPVAAMQTDRYSQNGIAEVNFVDVFKHEPTEHDNEPDFMDKPQSRDEQSKTFTDGPVPVALYTKLVYHQSESKLDNKHQEPTVQTDQCLITQRVTTEQQVVSQTIEKPYNGSVCSFGTAHKESLKRRERTHTGERYKCSLCSYSVLHRGDLKRHERTHTGEKPYKCTICSYGAARRQQLKAHERTHTGEKPYRCTMCPYSASLRQNVKKHERTHTGQKPYICTMCSCSFSQQQHLKIHERTHTGEKPYRCTMCSYSSAQRQHLKTHERSHTGEKSYRCTMCSYSSARLQHLKRHERTHTGEKPYKCARIVQLCENT